MKKLGNVALVCLFAFLGPVLLSGAQEPRNVLVVTGGTLIDGTGSPPIEDAVVVIRDGLFAEVGTRGEVTVPRDAETIDAGNRTLVPGLIDAHVHFSTAATKDAPPVRNDSIAAFGAAYFLHNALMGGITTVRDANAYHDVSLMAKAAFRDGFLLGARPIVAARGVTTTGGHGTRIPRSVEADGPWEFRKAVREQIKAGADVIKLLPPYTEDEAKAAIDEAHSFGMFITAHSGELKGQYEWIRWVVEAGVDCVEHAYAVPDDAIQMMADKGIYNVPTLDVLANLAVSNRGRPGLEWKVRLYEEADEIFQKMRKAGVKMAVGTDSGFPKTAEYHNIYFSEIERFVQNGYSSMEAIVAATKLAAEVCDASDRLGTVEKGKIADLLVIQGDPLRDIRELRKVQVILQGGKVIRR